MSHAQVGAPGRPPGARRRRLRASAPRTRSTRSTRCCARSAPTTSPSSWSFNKADVPGSRAATWPRATRAACGSRRSPARTSTRSSPRSATGCGLNDRVVTLRLPLDRGDLLAAAHREGEVLGRPRSTATRSSRASSLDAVGVGALRAVAGPARELLAAALPLRAPRRAAEAPGATRAARSTARSARPSTRRRRRGASRRWARRPGCAATRRRPARPSSARRRPAGWPGASASTVAPGDSRRASAPRSSSRTLAGSTCSCATPERDTVLYPAISLPDLRDGRDAGGAARGAGRRSAPDGLDLDSVDRRRRARALVLCGQLAVEPDRGARRPRRGGRVGPAPRRARRERRVLRASTPGRAPPRTILESGPEGVLAVHSASKRSNLAGAARRLLRRGPRPGRLPALGAPARGLHGAPRPVQAAAAVAYGDDAHVAAQRETLPARAWTLMRRALRRLRRRRPDARRAPSTCGRDATACDGWALARVARRGAPALVVSPGELYGEAGRDFVRVAVVQHRRAARARRRAARAAWTSARTMGR